MSDVIGGESSTPAELEAAAAAVVDTEWLRRPAGVRRVSSDVEETFLVDFGRGDRAVLKVAEPGRDITWFEFEAAIVEEALRGDPDLPLASGIPVPDGRLIVTTAFAGSARVARLMHHLEGRPSSATNPDSASRRRIGRTAGRLSLALAGVEHSVASRRVPWDLRGFEDLAPALESVLDARARAAVETALEVHAALLHETRQLPAQLSHNDLNGGNVLVSPHDPGSVSGIIDFGDAAYAPRVFDIGIAAAYAAAEAAAAGAGSPWSAAASFTLGYADAVPIDGDELALVPALARARLAQRVLIAAGRRVASPAPPTRDNDAWLATTQRDLLAIVATSPSDADDAPKEWR